MSKKARDIMSTDILSLESGKDVNFAEVLIEAKHIRHIPITNTKGILVGMLSIRDLAQHFSQAAASHFAPIKDIMSERIISTGPDTEIKELAKIMLENEIGALPIIESGKLVGLVTERDFLKLFVD